MSTATVLLRSGENGTWNSTMDRVTAIDLLIPEPETLLLIGSLGGPAQDVARISVNSARTYPLGGAMGAAIPMALGLAIAQPAERVVAVVGDGELMMSMGSLATAAVQRPPNFAVVCVDNGRYVETGAQLTHTAICADPEQLAIGAGLPLTRTARTPDEAADTADLVRSAPGPVFVRLVVTAEPAPSTGWELDGALLCADFRARLRADLDDRA